MSKDIFDSIRLTTLQVSSPLISIVLLRGKMIEALKEYIDNVPHDTMDNTEILHLYDKFIEKDHELTEIAKGRAEDVLLS